MERAQIIEKLKALKVGDYLVGTGEIFYYEKGKKYYIEEDGDGDKYVLDETNDREFINIGSDYYGAIGERIYNGQLTFSEVTPKLFTVDSVSISEGVIEVLVVTDNIGYERLKQLESEVRKASELATLERQRDEIQRKIDELKANGPK